MQPHEQYEQYVTDLVNAYGIGVYPTVSALEHCGLWLREVSVTTWSGTRAKLMLLHRRAKTNRCSRKARPFSRIAVDTLPC
jgi:hypothetical protein